MRVARAIGVRLPSMSRRIDRKLPAVSLRRLVLLSFTLRWQDNGDGKPAESQSHPPASRTKPNLHRQSLLCGATQRLPLPPILLRSLRRRSAVAIMASELKSPQISTGITGWLRAMKANRRTRGEVNQTLGLRSEPSANRCFSHS